jgi:3-oxoacyl-[acyl-carrier protein] reductase
VNGLIDLSGKNAVVTGGSRGIGRATALLLASAGACVGIGYRNKTGDADAVVGECRALGVHAWALGGDLASRASAEALFARSDEEFDGLDIFVGNHGIWPSEETPLADMSDEQWAGTVAANLHSVFYTCRAAARRLRVGGRVILVSSTAAQRGEAYHGDYAATKGALISLVKSLCVELGARGITVNAVAPGWVDTDMAKAALVGEGRERIASQIPIGRIATASDVAGPIVFLCSELGRHVTGEVLNVNGGSVLAG